jgi:molecular chaperone GrpE
MSKDSKKEAPEFQVMDRRFWVEDEAAVDKATVAKPKYPSFVEELKARTEASEMKLRERLEQIDSENTAFRQRLTKDFDRQVKGEKADLLRDILDVVDNLERAVESGRNSSDLEALLSGVELILAQLVKKLGRAEVEVIESKGQVFNPEEAEAMGMISVDDPELDQKVVEVIKKGYRLADGQVLRPALVMVGNFEKKPAEEGQPLEDEDN